MHRGPRHVVTMLWIYLKKHKMLNLGFLYAYLHSSNVMAPESSRSNSAKNWSSFCGATVKPALVKAAFNSSFTTLPSLFLSMALNNVNNWLSASSTKVRNSEACYFLSRCVEALDCPTPTDHIPPYWILPSPLVSTAFMTSCKRSWAFLRATQFFSMASVKEISGN